jgi:hypothetical protein
MQLASLFHKIMQCTCFRVKSPSRTVRNRRGSYNETRVGRPRITYPPTMQRPAVKAAYPTSAYRYNHEYRLVTGEGEFLHDLETELDIHNEKVLHTTEASESDDCISSSISIAASYNEVESRPIISYIMDLNCSK